MIFFICRPCLPRTALLELHIRKNDVRHCSGNTVHITQSDRKCAIIIDLGDIFNPFIADILKWESSSPEIHL